LYRKGLAIFTDGPYAEGSNRDRQPVERHPAYREPSVETGEGLCPCREERDCRQGHRAPVAGQAGRRPPRAGQYGPPDIKDDHQGLGRRPGGRGDAGSECQRRDRDHRRCV
jgi:hypothetical protein